MSGQSKLFSVIESLANTAIGFFISLVATIVVLPLFGLNPSFSASLGITLSFTVISIVRGYFLRRLFNYIHIKQQEKNQ